MAGVVVKRGARYPEAAHESGNFFSAMPVMNRAGLSLGIHRVIGG